MTSYRCAHCGDEHDLGDLEPTFTYPDAYLEIPKAERKHRTLVGSSDCRIRNAADTERRYFLRTLMPIPVHGDQPCSWGIWVEVTETDFQRAWDLWDDPHQGNEPPFVGYVANRLESYPDTIGLPGLVHLVDPATRPTFTLALDLTHPLAQEQRDGVGPERVFEWLGRQLHP